MFSFGKARKKSEDLEPLTGGNSPASASRGAPPPAQAQQAAGAAPNLPTSILAASGVARPPDDNREINKRVSLGSVDMPNSFGEPPPAESPVASPESRLSQSMKQPRELTPAQKKREKQKADALRFKLNTPPTAQVEVTGIYTDRSHNRKYAGRPSTNDGPIRPGKSKKDGKSEQEKQVNARGRTAWKDEEQTKRNLAMWNAEPLKPEVLTRLPNFSGEWMCSATSGDWDEFLYLLNVPEFKRKLAKARKWGVRHSEQKIVCPNKHQIQITNHYGKMEYTTNAGDPKAPPSSDGAAESADAAKPASSTPDMMLDINGAPQKIVYEGQKGSGVLRWEGTKLVTRMELDKLGPCIITRTMGDDTLTMVVDVNVSYIHASRTFKLRSELVY